MKRILVIGSSNVDMVMGLPRLPLLGETVTDGRFMQTFGGKGANQAIAAQRAGANVSLMTCLGKDDHGRAVAQQLASDGLDLSLTVHTVDAPTGTALVMFDSAGHNYLAVAPGSNYRLLAEHVFEVAEKFSQFAMLMVQCEIPEATLIAALSMAKVWRLPVLLNYAPARELAQSLAICPNTGIVVNELEATSMTKVVVKDPRSAFEAARSLREEGYSFAVVTLGEAGACCCSAGGEDLVPAISVDAVDTTAAGDTFCGALAVALAEGRFLSEGIRFATAAAALCVQRAGAQPSIPYRDEIERMLHSQVQTVARDEGLDEQPASCAQSI